MAAESFFGPVNILVNNAGILGAMAKTAEITEADYLKVCAINQHSVFYGMRAVLPAMLRAGGAQLRREHPLADTPRWRAERLRALHGDLKVTW